MPFKRGSAPRQGLVVLARSNRCALAAAALIALAACATVGPLASFTTDGCSLFPDRDRIAGIDWCDCCLAHDLAYWRGGTEGDRLQADRALRACVAQRTGDPALAENMFLGVRAGGGPEFNTPYRWGYGWPYGRGYRALSEAEAASARSLEQAYRAGNPGLQCRPAPSPAVGKARHTVPSRQAPCSLASTWASPISIAHGPSTAR